MTTEYKPLHYRVRRSEYVEGYYAEATEEPDVGWNRIGDGLYLIRWGAILVAYVYAYKDKWRHFHPKKPKKQGPPITDLGRLP